MKRIDYIITFIMFGFAVVILRMTMLYIAKHYNTASELDQKSITSQASESRRLDIVDRNGILIATNTTTKSLYINLNIIEDLDLTIDRIVPILTMGREEIKARLANKTEGAILIARKITPKQHQRINQLGIFGVFFEDEQTRIYPSNDLFAHLAGFVDIDNKGLAGVEKFFDKRLSGKTKVGNGLWKARQGPLVLAADQRIQGATHYFLNEAVKNFSARGAVAIVLDVTNGEVLSLVSLPDFNPNSPELANNDERFNRATYGLYEIGSIFKIFTMALALENKIITPDTKFNVSKPLERGGFAIKDFHQYNGFYSATEILSHSSNIGAALIAEKTGVTKQKEFMANLGLTARSNIDLVENASPLYPNRWTELSMLTISYGHGIAVTPLHVANAVAGLVSDGRMKPAQILKADKVQIGEELISENTRIMLRQMLRTVVALGSGKSSDVSGYDVGGKTGTAEKITNDGVYSKNKNLPSFVGIFPIQKPKYLVFVMIDEPKTGLSNGARYTGGAVAAPVVGQIIKSIAAIEALTPVAQDTKATNINKHND